MRAKAGGVALGVAFAAGALLGALWCVSGPHLAVHPGAGAASGDGRGDGQAATPLATTPDRQAKAVAAAVRQVKASYDAKLAELVAINKRERAQVEEHRRELEAARQAEIQRLGVDGKGGRAVAPPPAPAKVQQKKKVDRERISCGEPEPEKFVPDPRKESPVKAPVADYVPTGKIYCWVATCPNKHPKALAVNKSWGARFDKVEFMSSADEAGLNMVLLPLVNETRRDLFTKTKMAWSYAYNNHINDFDWFVKADDDSYIVVDNLRRLLSKLDPRKPHYLGRHFVMYRGRPDAVNYNSGGASYLLSREALRIMGENKNQFVATGHSEDVWFGKSLAAMNITPGDTRDEEGRETFLPLRIDHLRYKHTRAKRPDYWLWNYSYYPAKEHIECCSKYWISSHYMYTEEFAVYDALVASGREASGRDPPESEWRVINY